MDPHILFQETIKHCTVDLSHVRLFTTVSITGREAALLYIGPDRGGREAVAQFQCWLSPWLTDRRRDIADCVGANEIQGACKQIRAFAGPTEVLRALSAWGPLQWSIALHMVGGLATDAKQFAQAYFESAADLLQSVLGITVSPHPFSPNTGPQRPVTANLLYKGLPIGDDLRGLLMWLEPAEQLQLLEQLVFDRIETFPLPFEPLTR